LDKHGLSLAEYKKFYPFSKIGFSFRPNELPKNDRRYKKWLESLKRRSSPWNKGKTKETNTSVKKISETFKNKKIDNFKNWRQEMIKAGVIKNSYSPFKKTKELAFLIGMTLGDGHIQKFPRTERLLISLNTKYPGLIEYVNNLMTKIFEKQATLSKVRNSNCMRVWVYQKMISSRLEIPTGNRGMSTLGIPGWIWKSKTYIIFCLKGLFEAEGSLSIHLPTYTYNFGFSNKNQKLLDDVEMALRILGFNPEVRSDKIRLRKKEEVFLFKKLINFRKYNAG
jgi:hypothetical protein